MKIIELNIVEFGGIKDKKISLDQKFNIICGENESGKSTLVLFIKFMLYGLGRKGVRSDREKALSLDGHRAAGSMLVECGGEKYLIERRASGVGRVTESVKLLRFSDGAVIEGEPGEILLGVPLAVFESSAYVSQMKAADVENPQTSSAIENMLVSADESIDVAGILDRLDRIRKEYKLNRGEGGSLYDTEQRISALKKKHEEQTKKYLEISDISAKLERKRKALEEGEQSHFKSKSVLDNITNALILQRFEELDEKCAQLDGVKGELDALIGDNTYCGFVPDRQHLGILEGAERVYADAERKYTERQAEMSAFEDVSPSVRALAETGAQIQNDGGKNAVLSEAAQADKRAGKYQALGATLTLLTAVFGGAAAILGGAVGIIAAIACAVAAAVTLALGVSLFARAKKQRELRETVSARYGVAYSELEEYIDRCTEAMAACGEKERDRRELSARLLSADGDRAAARDALVGLLSKTLKSIKPDDALFALCISEKARIGEFCTRREKLEAQVNALGALCDGYKKQLSGYDREALRAETDVDIGTLTPEIISKARQRESFDRTRSELLQKEISSLIETLAGLRAGLTSDPAALADEICVLEQKHREDSEYYDALMLAKEHIERASNAMSTSVTPELGRHAGELMSAISNGEHNALQTTKNLGVSLEQGGFFLPSQLLSGGTRDAAYISLRIALMFRIYKDGLPPLILDESLCQLDDRRAGKLLELLGGLSDTVQCILLTCHAREQKLCEDSKTEVNVISLEK